MNADELTALVHGARRADTPPSTPPPDLLGRARQQRRRRFAATAVAAATVALAVAGVATWANLDTAHDPDVVEPAPAAPDTRLVGGHGVVIAVPDQWTTDTERTNTCPDAASDIVHFIVLPAQFPGGMCPGIRGQALPGLPSVAIRPGDADDSGGLSPAGDVGGMPYYERSLPSYVSTTIVLTVPAAHISFAATARNADDARALLETIGTVPAGLLTVDLRSRLALLNGPAPDPYDSQVVSDLEPASGLRARVREVDDAAPPGEFLRSDPPLGTPVAPGTLVTLTYSAGDLDGVVDDSTLRQHGWAVGPATSFDPAVDRVRAERTAATLTDSRQPEQAFLRTVGGRLTWLVERDMLGLAGTDETRLTAVDAQTGHITGTMVLPLKRG